MMKKITTIFIFLLLTNCGFSPIYKLKSDLKFNLIINTTEGEKEINRYIITHLEKYIDPEVDKKINLEIITTYSKINVSKDNRGSSTGYKLIATTTFNIIYEDNEKKFPFQKICHLVNLKMFLRKKAMKTKLKIILLN